MMLRDGQALIGVHTEDLPLPKTLSGQNTAYTFANQHITTNV